MCGNKIQDMIDAVNSREINIDFDTPIHHMFSDTQFEIIKKHITEYQKSLDENCDVAVMLASFGQSILMEITSIRYEKSVTMIFEGFVNGKPSVLIQHINQLNFLITSVSKQPDVPKRKIGFIAD